MPEFPLAEVRDDVRLHRIVLDYLGVLSVAVVIGGSMGRYAGTGMGTMLPTTLCAEHHTHGDISTPFRLGHIIGGSAKTIYLL